MASNVPVDRATIRRLIAKHDRSGPRYTSYPTAVEFRDLEDGLYEKHLAAADALGERPLSLYVHLPFCRERCLFCGCHVIITRHRAKAEPYLDVLAREIALVAKRTPNRRRFAQLHLGGGTPTYHPSRRSSLPRGYSTSTLHPAFRGRDRGRGRSQGHDERARIQRHQRGSDLWSSPPDS